MKLFNANIRQLNIGDLQGTLDNSFNIDLTFNQGKVSISPRTRITTDKPTDFGTPVGAVYFDGLWWCVAGNFVWKASSPQGAFAKDASNGGAYFPPTDCDSRYSDITVFNDHLIVSTQSRIYKKALNGAGTGGWDLVDSSLASAIVRPVTVYNNRLYWSRLPDNIVSCDTSWAISNTASASYNITLPSGNVITFIKPFSTGLYIGITQNDGTEGFVYDWNGETKNTIRFSYNVYAQGALSAYVDNTYFYMINSDSEIFRFNGGGFTFIARLPVKRNSLYNANATGSSGNDRFIHPNGMTLIDGRLSLLINATNNDASATQQDNIHSGIWEYVENIGLYHKYSMSYNTIGGTTTDQGQIRLKSVGCLVNTPDLSAYSDVQKGNFLAGAAFYSDATTIKYGMFTDNYYDNEQKAGFFSTVQIRASNFTDMFNKVTSLYTPTENMKYVVKYRTKKTDWTDFTMTWVNTTSFTTTQTGIEVGDEITIIQGTGSGRVAHVSAISFSSPNYTVTIDETIANVTGTAKARVQKWKKIDTITNVNNFFQSSTISNPSTLIELKVFMIGTGETTLDEMILDKKISQ